MAQEPFERLRVWKGAVHLVQHAYDLADSLPESEKSNLTAALKKVAAVIPAKIAEASEQESIDRSLAALEGANGAMTELLNAVLLCNTMRLVPFNGVRRFRKRWGKVRDLLHLQIRWLEEEQEQLRRDHAA